MIRWLLNVPAPLLLGAAIYLLLREGDLLVFAWCEAVGATPWLAAGRGLVAGRFAILPALVLYSLPDGIWVYAFTFHFAHLWRGAAPRLRDAWSSIGLLLACGAELGQAFGWVPGTADPWDIAAYGFAFVLGRHTLSKPESLECRIA